MNFGAKSKDLLVELKRSDWLPPYNEDGVRGVLAEIQALYDELTDTLGGRTTVRMGLRLHSYPCTYSSRPCNLFLVIVCTSSVNTRTLLPSPSLRRVKSDIPDPVKVSLVVHHQALLRNKRCLLTYLKWRADRWVHLTDYIDIYE